MTKTHTTAALITLSALALGLMTTGAHAADAASAPGKTRAEVKAEAVKANKNGTANTTEGSAATPRPVPTKSRAQVKSETVAAEKSGAIAKSGDQVVGGPAKPASSTTSRAQVKAATLKAEKDGSIPKAGDK
jgi:hypothetical protein